MEHERIQQILSAPVCHFVKSTDKEKELFPDKQGWFYTVKLASGQRFVAHMNSKDDVENVFTLRPLNHLLPDLKEIQWVESPYINGHGLDTRCELSDNVPEAEKKVYESALGPKPVQVPLATMPWIGQTIFQNHPLLKRLEDVHSLRLSVENSKKRLLDLQKQLKSIEISDEKKPVQQLLNLNGGRN